MTVEQLQIGYQHSDSPISILASTTRQKWINLDAARELATRRRRELESALGSFSSGDTSIVVFGSLARDEFTAGSDVDWTLLVDGCSDPAHLDAALAVRQKLNSLGLAPPGREGTFGNLAFSHELVHQIGGQDDTNANTTRRILLLLESVPVGRKEAYDRVLSNILHRYLKEDRGLWYGSGRFKIPRFLLNDIARYWRTMAVDFAYKQRSRGNEGWALRNIKLRMSRKLIFISGLLACFSCDFGLTEAEKKTIYTNRAVQPLVKHLRRVLSFTPLELVADTVLRYPELHEAGAKLFQAYDSFVGLLSDGQYSRAGTILERSLLSSQ